MASNGLAKVNGQEVTKDIPDQDQAYEAYKLQQAGKDWPTIAAMVGYDTGKVAQICVRQYLQTVAMHMEQEHREEVLQLEMDRLDRLLNTYWDEAIAGNIKAAEFVLKCIQTTAKLLGLDTLHEKVVQSSKTIVIAGNQEQYVQALKQIATSD